MPTGNRQGRPIKAGCNPGVITGRIGDWIPPGRPIKKK